MMEKVEKNKCSSVKRDKINFTLLLGEIFGFGHFGHCCLNSSSPSCRCHLILSRFPVWWLRQNCYMTQKKTKKQQAQKSLGTSTFDCYSSLWKSVRLLLLMQTQSCFFILTPNWWGERLAYLEYSELSGSDCGLFMFRCRVKAGGGWSDAQRWDIVDRQCVNVWRVLVLLAQSCNWSLHQMN